MGQSTTAIIKGKIDKEKFLDLLKNISDNGLVNGEIKLESLCASNEYIGRVSFKYKNKEVFILFAHDINDELNNYKMLDRNESITSLTTPYYEENEEVIRKILMRYGGWIDYDDCDYIGFEYVETKNNN